MASPYDGKTPDQWAAITQQLIDHHPLSTKDIVDVVLASWKAIFDSSLGSRGFRIGQHIFPKPQTLGFLLHELIPLELGEYFPGIWRGDVDAREKDLVHIPDRYFSIEVKTSSNKNRIFGNRSYAQKVKAGSRAKKAKSGYYLAVNFEKFEKGKVGDLDLHLIRFGWIDSTDWIGQKSESGQQSRLSPDVETKKLLTLYPTDLSV